MPTINIDTNTELNTRKAAVLVIEDDQDLGQLITFILAEEGYEAKLVRDGTLAMRVLQASQPNVIMLDIHLPGVSGLDILTYIRGEERLDHARVMVATADEKMAAACAEKADLVFCKPYTIGDLVSGVNQLSPK